MRIEKKKKEMVYCRALGIFFAKYDNEILPGPIAIIAKLPARSIRSMS
jgi:hypothetical protein